VEVAQGPLHLPVRPKMVVNVEISWQKPKDRSLCREADLKPTGSALSALKGETPEEVSPLWAEVVVSRTNLLPVGSYIYNQVNGEERVLTTPTKVDPANCRTTLRPVLEALGEHLCQSRFYHGCVTYESVGSGAFWWAASTW